MIQFEPLVYSSGDSIHLRTAFPGAPQAVDTAQRDRWDTQVNLKRRDRAAETDSSRPVLGRTLKPGVIRNTTAA